MAIGGLVLLIAAPILAIALVAGLVAVAVAVVAPLLPLLFIAFVVWFVLRASSPRRSPAEFFDRQRLRPPAMTSATPATTATIPTIGGSGTVFCRSAVA